MVVATREARVAGLVKQADSSRTKNTKDKETIRPREVKKLTKEAKKQVKMHTQVMVIDFYRSMMIMTMILE